MLCINNGSFGNVVEVRCLEFLAECVKHIKIIFIRKLRTAKSVKISAMFSFRILYCFL